MCLPRAAYFLVSRWMAVVMVSGDERYELQRSQLLGQRRVKSRTRWKAPMCCDNSPILPACRKESALNSLGIVRTLAGLWTLIPTAGSAAPPGKISARASNRRTAGWKTALTELDEELREPFRELIVESELEEIGFGRCVRSGLGRSTWRADGRGRRRGSVKNRCFRLCCGLMLAARIAGGGPGLERTSPKELDRSY